MTLLGAARRKAEEEQKGALARVEAPQSADWELVDESAPPAKKAPARPKSRALAGTKNKAKIHAVIGGSGTGKSSYIKKGLLKSYDRLLIWSPLEDTDDYASFCNGIVVRRITDLVEAVKSGAREIVYWPTGDDKALKKQFGFFCRIAFECRGATVLVEELSQVTMPSWAPPAWKKLSTAGRHRGLTLIGVSQRPANMDKDFLGNCTEIRCYRVNYDADAKVMSDTMRLRDEWNGSKTGKASRVRGMDRIRELPDFHFFHKNPDLSVVSGVNDAL